MENIFEKMPEEKQKNINETPENKKRETIQESIMDEIQHYMDFLNEVESVRELMSKLKFDFEKAEKIVENNMIDLMERINKLAADGKFSLVIHSSMEDILGNSVIIDMGLVKKQVLKQEINESKCKEYVDRLKKSLDAVLYYTNSLCDDNKKLEMELTTRSGYLEKFENYFYGKKSYSYNKEGDVIGDEIIESEIPFEKAYPTGISKIAYFRFFNEWKQKNIDQENLEKELEKLDGNFIDKDKIREDFKEKRQPQAS